jgi:uridine kinase
MRDKLLSIVSDIILSFDKPSPKMIAIDGVDGAGKTVFARELKLYLLALGYETVLVSVDDFHYPRNIRYRKGPDSPKGFYFDSIHYSELIRLVLDPFSKGEGYYHTTAFDCENDRPNMSKVKQINPNSILLMEGIFLQRPELVRFWDLKIFLDVDFKTNLQRNIDRANLINDPVALDRFIERYYTRYKPGQELYFAESKPHESADIVIDNNDYNAPILTGGFMPGS